MAEIRKIKKIIILGAPRSGTNILRDSLKQHPNFGTWECDEINPIWRYQNEAYPYDDLDISKVTVKLRNFIQKKFQRISDRQSTQVVIEKTCANCLRLDFVSAIIPDAYYVFIYRDGKDAVGSIIDRWSGPSSMKYFLNKLRFVPLLSVPIYLIRFLGNYFSKFSNSKRIRKSWGPRYREIDKDLKMCNIEEVAFKQWSQCVKKSYEFISQSRNINNSIILDFDFFIKNPTSALKQIFDMVGEEYSLTILNQCSSLVNPSKIHSRRDFLQKPGLSDLELRIDKVNNSINFNFHKKNV
jgi:hypothetical protein